MLEGLHHVTCVCIDAQETVDFYRDRLGFSLVKKTVNFDDSHSVHFRTPDGILVEIATDGPGFLVDEPPETPGRGLSPPQWLEPE